MSDQTTANWQWHSKQGTTCTENRDACGIYTCDHYTFSIVLDASSHGKRGIQFNACWITKVLDCLTHELPSEADVLSAFQEGQKLLRSEKFFEERASYIALLIPRKAQDISVFFCGDCSLGVQSPAGQTTWLTQSHTLANAFEALGIKATPSHRNTVTRTLKARRFHPPEILSMPATACGPWVLATDGYRYLDADEAGHPKDDCSALFIGDGTNVGPQQVQTNLFVRPHPPTHSVRVSPKNGSNLGLLRQPLDT